MIMRAQKPSSMGTHTKTANEDESVIKTCDNGARTKESWEKYEIGEFFLNKYALLHLMKLFRRVSEKLTV